MVENAVGQIFLLFGPEPMDGGVAELGAGGRRFPALAQAMEKEGGFFEFCEGLPGALRKFEGRAFGHVGAGLGKLFEVEGFAHAAR